MVANTSQISTYLGLPITPRGCGSLAFWMALLMLLVLKLIRPAEYGIQPAVYVLFPVCQGLLAVIILCRHGMQSFKQCMYVVLWAIGMPYQVLLVLFVVTLPLLLIKSAATIPIAFLGWTLYALIAAPVVSLFALLGGLAAFTVQNLFSTRTP
jgi:hypothetical protein